MELIALGVIVAVVAGLLWRAHAKHRAAKNALLNQAWHVVMEDPDYDHRRRYEERMRDYEERARKESEGQ